MNTVQRIAKNTGILFSAQIIAFLLAFFYTIYIARYLGPEGFGILSFALSLVLIMGIFTDLGLSTLLTREVSRDKSLQYDFLGNLIPIKAVLSVIVYAILIIIANSGGYSPQTVKVIYITGLYMLFTNFSNIFFALFQAYEKMEYHAISLLINNLLILVGTFYGISHGFDAAGFAFLYFLASLMVLIYCIIISIWKFFIPKISFDMKFWKTALKIAFPLTIATIFSTIAFRVDTILLELLQGSTAVGWYSAAFKLVEFLNFIPAVYTGAIFPVLSKFHFSSKESLKIVSKKSFKYMFILGLPIAAATTILAPDLILLFYQSSYNQSTLALQILIWSVPSLFLSSVFSVVFISINKPNILVKTTLISMIFNIGMNLILIPIFSYVGASIITVSTAILSNILCFYYFSRLDNKIHLKSIFLKPMLSTILMSVLMLLLDVNFYLLIIIAVISYLILLFIFRTFSDDDYNIFKQLFSGK